jgi:hypothetical protein
MRTRVIGRRKHKNKTPICSLPNNFCPNSLQIPNLFRSLDRNIDALSKGMNVGIGDSRRGQLMEELIELLWMETVKRNHTWLISSGRRDKLILLVLNDPVMNEMGIWDRPIKVMRDKRLVRGVHWVRNKRGFGSI